MSDKTFYCGEKMAGGEAFDCEHAARIFDKFYLKDDFVSGTSCPFCDLETMQARIEALTAERSVLRSAICINMREELPLYGLMTEDDYGCDTPDDVGIAAFLHLAAEHEADLSIADPLWEMANTLEAEK